MEPWEALALTATSILIIFSATILGMVRHNVLQDPAICCTALSACSETLSVQLKAYYDPVMGLRTRYIIAVVLFFFVGALRCTAIPVLLNFKPPTGSLNFMALVSYSAFLLFSDTTLRTFTHSPENLTPQCSEISSLISQAVGMLSWFIIILAALLFYLFIAMPETSYTPLMTTATYTREDHSIDDNDDGSEDIVLAPLPNSTTRFGRWTSLSG